MYEPNNGNNSPQDDFLEGVFIDYRAFDKLGETPIYEFGFGLSYTTFEYSSLKIDAQNPGAYKPASGSTPAAPTYGSISNTTVLGPDVIVSAGDGSSGKVGGKGGSLTGVTLTTRAALVTHNAIINAGNGGMGSAGNGGQGGAITSLKSLDGDFAQLFINNTGGNGGNSGALLTHDYVELFNRGDSPADVGGWRIHYTSSSGTSWNNGFTLPAGATIPAGGYYLVQMAGGSNGAPLPTPDATGGIAMAAGAGKLVLTRNDGYCGAKALVEQVDLD